MTDINEGVGQFTIVRPDERIATLVLSALGEIAHIFAN